MKLTIELTEAAKEDLLGIWLEVSDRGVETADRFVGRIHARIDSLATQPYQGERDTRFAGVRRVIVGSYLVFYRFNESTLLVLRVYHGARRIDDIDLSGSFD